MNYLPTLALTFIVTLTLCGVFNWAVDPYAMFWSPQVEGINSNKTEAGKRVRHSKPFRVSRYAPEILLIGNSRVEMGLSPKSAQFAGARVYNLAMPGIGLKRQLSEAVRQIAGNPDLQRVIISLDYIDFLFDESASHDYHTRPWGPASIPRKAALVELVELSGFILSIDTLVSSIKTLLSQTTPSNHITADGFNQPDTYLAIMHHEGIKPLFRQKINELTHRLRNPKNTLYPNHNQDNPRATDAGRFCCLRSAT